MAFLAAGLPMLAGAKSAFACRAMPDTDEIAAVRERIADLEAAAAALEPSRGDATVAQSLALIRQEIALSTAALADLEADIEAAAAAG